MHLSEGQPTDFAEAGVDPIRAAFEAIPHAVFIVDSDVSIRDCNQRALSLLGEKRERVLSLRSGEALHCLRHHDAPRGCGTHAACCECVIRTSVKTAIGGATVSRQFMRMQLRRAERIANADFLISTAPISKSQCMLMLENVTELLALRDLVPICCYCRSIRIDKLRWQRLEEYLHHELQVKLSHGLCPSCLKEHFPDVADEVETAQT